MRYLDTSTMKVEIRRIGYSATEKGHRRVRSAGRLMSRIDLDLDPEGVRSQVAVRPILLNLIPPHLTSFNVDYRPVIHCFAGLPTTIRAHVPFPAFSRAFKYRLTRAPCNTQVLESQVLSEVQAVPI
jgi:hypothetical protein